MNMDEYRKEKIKILNLIEKWTSSIAGSLKELSECISIKKNFCVDAIVSSE